MRIVQMIDFKEKIRLECISPDTYGHMDKLDKFHSEKVSREYFTIFSIHI